MLVLPLFRVPILVTMAASLTCERIQDILDMDCPVIRMMPNTPAAIGAGVIQYCGLGVTIEELDSFAALLAPAGLVDPVPEGLIDAASALSGCGPAFAYLFIEALADGGVACGLPRDKALSYAAQMAEGAARMVLESGKHPGELKDAVCSPGGTTIQGVRVLEERGGLLRDYDRCLARYGEKKALRMCRALVRNYRYITFLDTGTADPAAFEPLVRQRAEILDLEPTACEGTTRVLRKLFSGPWDDEFVIVPPGGRLDMSVFLSGPPAVQPF